MATEINKNNFLGSMFPNVYVKSIHLEKDYKVESKIKNAMTPGEVHHGSGPMTNVVSKGEKLKIKIKSEIYEQLDEQNRLSSLGAQGFEYYLNFTTVVMAPNTSNSDAAVAKMIEDFSKAYDKTSLLPIPQLKNSGLHGRSRNLYEHIIKPKLLMSTLGDSLSAMLDEAVKADPVAKNYKLKEKQIKAEMMTSFIKSMPSFQGHGGKTYAVPFETEIHLDVANQDNLAIVQFAEFNSTALAEDFPEFADVFFGKFGAFGLPYFQIIKHRGESIFQRKTFETPDGIDWHGPRHTFNPVDENPDEGDEYLTQEGMLMTGVVNTPESVPLTINIVPVNNVHDFTMLSKIEELKIDLDLDFLSSDFMNPTAPDEGPRLGRFAYNNDLVKDVINSLDLKSKEAIFSELYATRTTNTNTSAAAMFFSVDLKEIMSKYSAIPMIYSNDNMLGHDDVIESALKMSRLLNLKIYRERVFDEDENKDIDKQLIIDVDKLFIDDGGYGNGISAHNWDYKPRVYADVALKDVPPMENKPQDARHWLPKDYHKYSKDLSNVPRLQKINLHLPGDSKSRKRMMHFNLYDPTIPDDIHSPNSNGAKFKYSIEIRIEDGTVDFIQSKYNDLVNLSRALGRMLDQSNDKRYYDNKNDKFKGEQFRFMNTEVLSKRIESYLSILNLFSFPEVSKSVSALGGREELKEKIRTIIDPSTGASRDSISIFKKMIDDLAGTIFRTINLNKTTNKRGFFDTSDPGTDTKNPMKKVILLKHKFENLFDAAASKNVGYDYLTNAYTENPTAEPAWRGLLKLSPSQYFNKRVADERNKYFNTNAENLYINFVGHTGYKQEYNLGLVKDNEASYLSPKLVRVDQTNYDLFNKEVLSPSPAFAEHHRECILDILGLNEGNYKKNRFLYYSKQNQDNKEEIRKQVQLQEIISKYNVSINSVDHGNFNSDVDLDMVDDEIGKIYEFSTAALGDPKEENSDDYKEIIQTVSGMINEKTNKGSTLMLSIISKKIFNKLPLHRVWKGTSGLEKYDITNKTNILNSLSNKKGAGKGGKVGGSFGLPFDQWLLGMPNQIKALFVSGDPKNETTRYNFFKLTKGAGNDTIGDVNDLGKFYLNFQKLVKVEYLESYGNPSTATSMKDARWKTLKDDITAKGTNKMLLCRLVPYKDPNIVECDIPELDLPMYNQYFLLDPSKT